MTQHQDILEALRARDPDRAEAAALVHVAATEAWFNQALGDWAPRSAAAESASADEDGTRKRAL